LLGCGRRSGALLAFAAGIGTEDDKECYSADDDAGDDDEQEGTAEGWSFVGRRGGGGCHEWLDAEFPKVQFSDAVERWFRMRSTSRWDQNSMAKVSMGS
jgi:hypothetical protein